jgi:hypothetical protein
VQISSVEPSYEQHPVEEIEPEMTRTDAIAELSERLAFAFAWMLDARDSKAVSLRVYVAAHHFCPSFIGHQTLASTGSRLGVTRQAVGKLSSELRDLLGVRPVFGKSNENRIAYSKGQTGRREAGVPGA